MKDIPNILNLKIRAHWQFNKRSDIVLCFNEISQSHNRVVNEVFEYSVPVKYIGFDLKVIEKDNSLYNNTNLIRCHQISNNPLNYNKDDVKDILVSNLLKDSTKEKISYSPYPSKDSLMKVLYLSTKKVTKNWTSRAPEWGEALRELEIMYEGRI